VTTQSHECIAETPAEWRVQVRGRDYGPFQISQLVEFVREGRIRPATLVSNNGAKSWIEARSVPALEAALSTVANRAHAEAPEAANLFVHAAIFSSASSSFICTLESLGRIAELAPGFWLVRTRHTSGVVRNTLSQTLERGDRFIVVDSTRDRFAWFNLGPEVDVRIKGVWNAALASEPGAVQSAPRS